MIRGWIEAGRLAPVDPHHLIFMIWAITQHYADFETQIRAVLGVDVLGRDAFTTAQATLDHVLLNGIGHR